MSDQLLESLRSVIVADSVLAARVAGRVYPDLAPSGEPLPYIVYTDVSLLTDQNFSGVTGDREARIQFDCYAKTKTAARTIREALLAVLDGKFGLLGNTDVQHSALSNLRSGYDSGEGIRNYSVDINFQYTI